MNKRDTATVLSALRAARVLLTADRQTHFDSNVSNFTGQLPRAELPLARAYDTALRRIDRSIVILDSSAAIKNMLARGCLGVPSE